jgi:glycine/D-amino acid oxidase-like deaminating enzyme
VTQPLWWEGAPITARTEPGDVPATADVAIVGGGFTGLWTAYYLLRADPSLDVLVLEAEHVGFGASGRNGGWVSALYPVGAEKLAAVHGRDRTLAFLEELRQTVVEVGDVCREEGIDAGFRQGGMIAVARGPAQAARARAEAGDTAYPDGTVWLGPEEARERLDVPGALGATYNPHCARVQPRRLADGVAAAVRRLGGRIVEGVRARELQPGCVVLADGRTISARHVLRATEAWTAQLPGSRRAIAPVYSLIVATAPLPQETWDRIGLAEREVFADHGHVVIYGQRTMDDRIAFGGRGAPYHWRSTIRPDFDSDERVFAQLRSILVDLFPVLSGVECTHAWGGPLGIARDWHPSVGHDPATGMGWAGGYVGDGVAATNLAGRTLADLVLAKPSRLVEHPWVGHHSPAWEPEPLRWLGVNAGLRLAHLADAEESRTGRPARLGSLLSRLTGN